MKDKSNQFSTKLWSVSFDPSSKYDHYARSLGLFENKPMAVPMAVPMVNGYSAHNKMEERPNGLWQTVDEFPFVNNYIGYYSMVKFNEELKLFDVFLFYLSLAFLN